MDFSRGSGTSRPPSSASGECPGERAARDGVFRGPWFLTGIILALSLTGCATVSLPAAPMTPDYRDVTGIEVTAVRLASAGYMIDLRYRVLDPAKAGRFLNRSIQPAVLDQTSGARLLVPTSSKVGRLSQTGNPPRTGITYFIFFGNPGRLVKPGGRVTLELGEVRVRDLVVD